MGTKIDVELIYSIFDELGPGCNYTQFNTKFRGKTGRDIPSTTFYGRRDKYQELLAKRMEENNGKPVEEQQPIRPVVEKSKVSWTPKEALEIISRVRSLLIKFGGDKNLLKNFIDEC